MRQKYSFLQDELALIEIRKHKWLESEKQKREIGFATAAMEWIQKYGEGWLQARLKNSAAQNLFVEKRSHRRFKRALAVTIKSPHQQFAGYTHDISLVGLSCTMPASVAEGLPTEIALAFPGKNGASSSLQFKSRIRKVLPSQKNEYRVFVPFTDSVRDYLRANVDILN